MLVFYCKIKVITHDNNQIIRLISISYKSIYKIRIKKIDKYKLM